MSDLTNSTPPPQTSGEDSFLILRYCREHFQRRLEEIIKLAGITSPRIIDAFSREVTAAHDELASDTSQDGFEQTAGLTASRISLVGNDDLELDIRIGDVANHLKSNDQIDHWRVQLRYMTLLNRPKMTSENNPVGVEPIRRGIWTICRENGLTLEQNLDLLDSMEEAFQTRLPEVYMELNGLLEHHHIEPAQVHVIRQQGGPGGQNSASGGNNNSGSGGNSGNSNSQPIQNALSSLQQALQQQFSANESPAGQLSDGAIPYSAGNSGNTGNAGNITLSASTLVMLNHLMERLSVLEMQQFSGLSNGPSGEITGNAPLRALRSKDLDLPLGKPASIALDTLSLIFEAIFSAPDLPDVVKASISRLQIPLLKQAIIDPSFFNDSQHPARQLINRMARAATGLAEDTGRDHPVCASLGKLADDIRSSLESNDSDLSPHIQELDALILERDQSTQALARPYIELVSEHETHAAALAGAQNWLLKTRSQVSRPEIIKFLNECWLRVMQEAHKAGGATGERWRESELAIDELLWSIEPKNTAEERKQLLTLIPTLLKRINAGLDLAQVSIEERTPFLNFCFDLQSAALRSRPGMAEPITAKPAEQDLTPDISQPTNTTTSGSVEILERDGKLVQYFGLATSTQSPWRNSGSTPWKEGDWISFQLPDGERLCGRHTWRGSPSGTVLLFNIDWGFAVALSPAMLEQQIRDDRASVVSNASLFDDAAQKALGQMTLI